MLQLNIQKAHRDPLHLLCIGAHSDDIELGCGGALLDFLTRYTNTTVTWVVLSGVGDRQREAESSAARFLGSARKTTVNVEQFRDGYYPTLHRELKDYFEQLKKTVTPDVIFTHCGGDLHQDHRIVSELTWNTWRNHWILEYEIVKYDGGLGSPNVFVPLSAAAYKKKVQLLMKGFASQRSKRWFTKETFLGLMRIRGVECNAPSGYAEAFYARKTVI